MMALRGHNLCLFSYSLSPSPSLFMMGVLPFKLVYRMKETIGTGEKNRFWALEALEVQEEIVGLRL